MGTGDYLVGAAHALIVLGGCWAAGHLVVVRQAAGAPRLPAVFVAATTVLVLVHLLPGLLGLLAPAAVLGLALAAPALATRLPVRPAGPAPAPLPEAAEPGWAWPLALVTAAASGLGALAFLLSEAFTPLTAVDALSTHLPTVARWIQEGDFWQLVQYTPDLSNATYPHTGTLLLLASVLPWDASFAARFVNVPFLVAAAAAVHLTARQLGAGRSAALLAATAVTALAAVNEPALAQAQVDAPMLAWLGLGILFLVRAARGADTSELVLAGIALGLAFGTKWYAVAYVPLVVAAFAVAVRRLRPVALVGGLVVAVGGVWLVRNWVEAGNPVHPADVTVAGVNLFEAPPDPLRDLAGFTIWDYLLDGRVWREHLLPDFWANFGPLGPLLLVGATVALGVALRRRARGAGLVAATSLLGAALYTRLPDTAFGLPGQPVLAGANARYLVPALLGAAVVAAWLGRGALPLLAAGVAVCLLESYEVVTLEDLWRAAVLVGIAVGGGRLAAGRAPRWAIGLVALAVIVAGGWTVASRVGPAPYAGLDPAAAVLAQVPEGGRVALGGTWDTRGVSPVLPAFGDRLRNRVDYLGRFVDGTLRQWDSAGPFRSQLARRRYDVLVLGKGIPATPDGAEPLASWARTAGYGFVLADTPRFLVLGPNPG